MKKVKFADTLSEDGQAIFSLCKSHPSKPLDMYCSFCKTPICMTCKTSTHARHVGDIKGFDSLKRAANSRRSALFRLLDTKECSVIPKLKHTILQISESNARLNEHVADGIRTYQEHMSLHRDKWSSYSDSEWVNVIKYRARTYYQLFDEKIDYLTAELTRTISSLAFVRQCLETSTDPELLLLGRSIRNQLQTIHPLSWPREAVSVKLKLRHIHQFGAVLFPPERLEKYCKLEFVHEITIPAVYNRVYDTKVPAPRWAFENKNASISISTGIEAFVAYGKHIFVYPIDNRRHTKVSLNVRNVQCVVVTETVTDITCNKEGNVYILTPNSVRFLTKQKAIRKCFNVTEKPSGICVSNSEPVELLVAFYDASEIVKYTKSGKVTDILRHSDLKQPYRPRHISMNLHGDVAFSDGTSTVTLLDRNGIWKCNIKKELKTSTSCGAIRPTGISCSNQRHVFIIDANACTGTKLHIYSEEGRYLQTIVFSNIQYAQAVHVDYTGDVWLGFTDGRIRIYRPSILVPGAY